MLADLACIEDRKKRFCYADSVFSFKKRLANKSDRALSQRTTECTEHWTVICGLRSRNRGVGFSHYCGCDRAAFQNHVGLHTKECRVPDTNIGELSNFNGAYVS